MQELRAAAGGAVADPFLLPIGASSGLSSFAGKAPRPSALVPSQLVLVMLEIGQSNGTNILPTKYVPTYATSIDCINVHDGGLYEGADPIMGTEGVLGNVFNWTADKVIAGGLADRIIHANVCAGATTAAQWAGILNLRFQVVIRRLLAAGLAPSPTVRWVVIQKLGESDNAANITQADFAGYQRQIIDTPHLMGIEGVPFFLCKSTYYAIAKPSSTAIRAAIDSVLGNNVFLGSDSDDLTGPTYRQPGDSPHLNDLGASVDSTRLFNALDAVL